MGKLPGFVKGIRMGESAKIELLSVIVTSFAEKFADVVEACFDHVELLAQSSDDPVLHKVFDEMIFMMCDKCPVDDP
jgi:hypothetical protein